MEVYEAFQEYLSHHSEFSQNTRVAYLADLKQFADFVASQGVRELRAVLPEHLLAFYLELQSKGYSLSTISRKLAAIRSFYKYLGETHGGDYSDLFSFTGPTVPKRKPRSADGRILRALVDMALAKGTALGLRDGAMVSLLSWSGIHVAELVGLNLEDLDLNRRVLKVRRGGHDKEVWVSQASAEIAREYLAKGRPYLVAGDAETALFVNQKGRRLTRQGFWVVLKTYAQKLGVDLSPQLLRHGRWQDV